MGITNEHVTAFFRDKYVPATEKLKQFRLLCTLENIHLIYPETETLLNILLKMKNPRRILEIGTGIGYSGAFFAQVCPEAEIDTVEKDLLTFREAEKNLRYCGLEGRVHTYLGDGQKVTEKLAEEGYRYDFIFIDAAKSHYLRFLKSALVCAEKEALIVSDNILMHGMTADEDCDPRGKHKTNIRKMREYLDFITEDPCLETALLSTGDGVAVTLFCG